MGRKLGAELAIGVLLLLSLAAAALSIYAGNRKSEHWGPRVIERANSGEIWLIIDQDLYIADPSGALRQRIDLSHLPGPVNAMTAVPIGDAQFGMLLGVIKQQDWLLMDGTGHEVGRITPGAIDMPFNETFHLASSPDGLVAVGSGGDHRVLLFDATGKFLAQSAPGLFRYANGLWFEDGRWWVVDTNHHQVRQLAGDSLAPMATIPVAGDGMAIWPALARRSPVGQGAITVSVMRHGMQVGVVQELDAEGKLLHAYPLRAKLPEPTDFLWLDDDRLLIADRADFSLQLFNRSGQNQGDWGDEKITQILKNTYEERQFWSVALRFAQIAAGLLGGLALLGYTIGKHLDATVKVTDFGDGKGIVGASLLSSSGLRLMLDTFRFYWPIFFLSLLTIVLILGLSIPAGIFVVVLLRDNDLLMSVFAIWAGGVLGAALIAMHYFIARFTHKRAQDPRHEGVLA